MAGASTYIVQRSILGVILQVPSNLLFEMGSLNGRKLAKLAKLARQGALRSTPETPPQC